MGFGLLGFPIDLRQTKMNLVNVDQQSIRSFIIESFLFGRDNGLQDDASLLEQGIIDSTGVMELVAHVEKTYGITVADDELLPENLDSINAIVKFLERKRG
jgi:acyl carrier protein